MRLLLKQIWWVLYNGPHYQNWAAANDRPQMREGNMRNCLPLTGCPSAWYRSTILVSPPSPWTTWCSRHNGDDWLIPFRAPLFYKFYHFQVSWWFEPSWWIHQNISIQQQEQHVRVAYGGWRSSPFLVASSQRGSKLSISTPHRHCTMWVSDTVATIIGLVNSHASDSPKITVDRWQDLAHHIGQMVGIPQNRFRFEYPETSSRTVSTNSLSPIHAGCFPFDSWRGFRNI
jgi:hypothetical protein